MPISTAAKCRQTCVVLFAGIVGTAIVAAQATQPTQPSNPPTTTAPAAPSTAPPSATPPVAPAPKPPEKPVEPEVVVVMNDGRRFSGFLIEKNPLEIIIRVASIRTVLKAESVDRLEILPPLLERYKELRKAIDDHDADQLLRLVEWLVARREFDIALVELDGLLKRQPTHGATIRARQNLLRQIELRDKATPSKPAVPSAPGSPAAPEVAPPPASTPEPDAPGGFENFPYLPPEDINLIKVFEIDLAKPPRIDMPREVMTTLLDRYAGHPALPSSREGRDGVYRLSSREQLDLLFRVRARDLYAQVRVLDQPETMRAFREDIQRGWLTASCATSACHGGADAGRLVLANRKPAADPALYTNFYILSKFKLTDGTPLIDTQNPDRSALLQMGLPREGASPRHPAVLRSLKTEPGAEPQGRDAWTPVFRGRDDRRFTQAVDWIKSLHQPRPDYTLRYAPARPFEAPPNTSGKPGDR